MPKSLNYKDIAELRGKIDLIDNQIVELMISRHEVSEKIISLKKSAEYDVFDKSREKEIIRELTSKYGNKLSVDEIKAMFNVILKYSKLRHNSLNEIAEASSVRDVLCYKPFIIAGPCTVESDEQMEKTVSGLAELGIRLLRGGTFKPRTSPDTFQGLGAEGVKILRKYAEKYNMFTVTEVLDEKQLLEHYDDIDVIQIGSRNMTNFSFLNQVGKITTRDKKPVILKRGYGSTLNEFVEAGRYITQFGNENVILCLRGIRTFEQIDSNMRNTPDLGAISELKDKSDLNIIFDPSHATGVSKYVVDISKAAVTLGADGLLIEAHHNPAEALIDGKQTITPSDLVDLITFIKHWF